MNRPFIVIVALFASLAGVIAGVAASRNHSATFLKLSAPSRTAAPGSAKPSQPAAASRPDPPAQQDQDVIEFAGNPMPLPPFQAPDLAGQTISSAALHGKVVLLSFWATWCPPCREEIPELIDIARRYKDRVQIVGISLDDSPVAEVRDFVKQAGINYPVVMGSRAIISAYGGVPALPTTFVVNQQGNVVQKHVGLYPTSTYDEEIQSLLGMPTKAIVKTFEDTGQIFLKNAARATELPGVDLSRLSPGQKTAALKRLNSETCSCGCSLTLAQCRINDTTCPVSKEIAAKVVSQIAGKSAAAPPPSTQR